MSKELVRHLPLICPPHHLRKATRLAQLFSKNASSTSPIRIRALVSALQGVLLSHADYRQEFDLPTYYCWMLLCLC